MKHNARQRSCVVGSLRCCILWIVSIGVLLFAHQEVQGTLATTPLASPAAVEHFPTDANLNETIEVFQQWFEKHYYGKPKVRLSPAGEGMRLGVFATEDITPESLYLAIPLKIVIAEETMFPTPVIGPALRQLQSKFQQSQGAVNRFQVTLALFLMYERLLKGKDSFWHPYFSLIPTEHDMPEFYSDAELDLLKGTSIKEKALHQRDVHKREYQWLKRNVFPSQEEVFPSHTFTEENYLWAAGILGTRMIWWDGAPHLVPMLDMINCRQGPNPHRIHSTARGTSGRTADTYAPWRFKKGDQVFENYGQPNPTYFLYHGFVMLPNVHDCAFVQLHSFVPSAARPHLDRLKLRRLELCVSPKKHSDLLVIGRVVASAEVQRQKMREAPQQRLKTKRERKALKFAGEIIKAHLKEFPPADDPRALELLNSTGTSFRVRMALQFRESQHKLLTETLVALRRISASIKVRPKPSGGAKKETTGGKDEL